MTLFGAIEAGGTKFVCGIGSAERGSRATAVIPTARPTKHSPRSQPSLPAIAHCGPSRRLFPSGSRCRRSGFDHRAAACTEAPGLQGSYLLAAQAAARDIGQR
jgi:fructokinase